MSDNKEEENLGSFYMGRMRPPPEPQRSFPKGLVTVLILLGFGGVLWYAYPTGTEKYENVDVPVITADKTPYKSKPENPGGMEVRHQDSTVFDPIEHKGDETVEKLLPTPETPVNKTEVIGKTAAAEKPILEPKKAEMNLAPQLKEDATEEASAATPAPTVAAGTPIEAPKVVKTQEAETAGVETGKMQELEKLTKTEPSASSSTLATEEAPRVVENLTAIAKAEPVKTTSVKKAETAKAAKPVKTESKLATAAKASAGNIYIQLGSYRTVDGAKSDWTRLQKKFPQFLSGLSIKTEQINLGAKGTFNRLQAGKLSEARAHEICATLKSENSGGCILVK